MDLSTIPVATLQTWLTEARDAYRTLMTGRREVSLSRGVEGVSRSVTFTQANIADLAAWIMQLETALSGGLPRRRAIGVRF